MEEGTRIYSVYIGENDIFEWLQSDGKSVLMPELLVGFETLLLEDFIDEVKVLRVESLVRGQQKAFDFYARRNEMEDSLNKIMDWALGEEEYEICERVKNLREYIIDVSKKKKKKTLL